MSLLSSFKNSLLSATNENNASLANLKFDFSLLKVEAPIEFQPLGSALTLRRREEAEYGPQHQTARRLAALFEPLIPPTPRLISAYGTRVSEIIETPGINPVGTRCHGPFKDYIGADGTAVWAAATSGVAALGIYLLSCILARAWDSKEAISIWVELVEERKREIQNALESNLPVSGASVMSSLQSIPRHDLALWDASSRSWLRSADQAKQREHDQLLLMLKNINIPFPGGSSTYDKVLSTWKRAMLAIEDLLCGRPQSISDASVLLALSSWHLYPDLIVLRNKTVNVKFRDPLFPSTGVCTIGLHIKSPKENEGVQWSLALSHLQYYGSAINVTSPDHSRVTISQLCLVALGGLLGHWGVNSRDFEDAAKLFCCIGDIMERPLPRNKSTVFASKPTRWLQPLIQASRKFNASTGGKKAENLRLLKYGQRRAKKFLRRDEDTIPPYFGLCNELVLSVLLDRDCEIEYLREVAKSMGYASGDCIIVRPHWRERTSHMGIPDYFEYITAVPHKIKVCGKRDLEEVYKMAHARWYSICSYNMVPSEMIKKHINHHIAQIKGTDEHCTISWHGRTDTSELFEWLKWHNPPPLFHPEVHGQAAASDPGSPLSEELGACIYFELSSANIPSVQRHYPRFVSVYGGWYFTLFVRETVKSQCGPDTFIKYGYKTPREAVEYLCQSPLSLNTKLGRYLLMIDPREHLSISEISISTRHRVIPMNSLISLDALYCAITIYRNLDGSTTLLRTASQPLCEARWAVEVTYEVKGKKDNRQINTLLGRKEAFACIAHLDSGNANISPSDLEATLAMCAQNSIFVAAAVLSDPADLIQAHDIRRLVGNIGRKGISMLVAPRNPQIRSLQDDYRIVNHDPYDFKRENNFSDTSLHLTFTDWTLPLATRGTQTIDQDVYFIESVISVRDRGEWVADLDILGIDKARLTLGTGTGCRCHHDEGTLMHECTSIDCWEELLDPPMGVGVFRAHGNWVARLAAVSILMQKSKSSPIGIFNKDLCSKPFKCQFQSLLNETKEMESPMSFICID